MPTYAALFLLCAAASSAARSPAVCDNPVQCPCGGKNFTICLEPPFTDHPCSQWEGCKSCQDGLTECLECPDGFEGPFCTKVKLSRQKRQSSIFRRQQYQSGRVSLQYTPLGYPAEGGCRDLNTPKLGSMECSTLSSRRSVVIDIKPDSTSDFFTYMRGQQENNGGYSSQAHEFEKTCTGTCPPGYTFENMGSQTQIQLRCQNGFWTPMTSFPPCISGGYCALEVVGDGSFNCTNGMQGTRCDVRCSDQYVGQYSCYPGQSWEPPLPRCVRRKGYAVPAARCRCEYGGGCDRNGNCICPVGRTGTFCQRRLCPDPGFIANGERSNMDGRRSPTMRWFEDGESVHFRCIAGEFDLRGSAFLDCKDGRWSDPPPICIEPVERRTCPDPGFIANGYRSNMDGRRFTTRRFGDGESVQFRCNAGEDALRGSAFLDCKDGRWSDPPPICIEPVVGDDYCPPPGRFQKGMVLYYQNGRDLYYPDINSRRTIEDYLEEHKFPIGSRLEYYCDSENTFTATNMVCQDTREWSADPPTCTVSGDPGSGVMYCPNPGNLLNGQVHYLPQLSERRRPPPSSDADDSEYPLGARLQYSCNAGYILEGTDLVTCRSTGLWSDKPPTCISSVSVREVMHCDIPDHISDGRVTPILPDGPAGSVSGTENILEYPEGTRLQYTCEEGYSLNGSPMRTCQPSGHWSSESPQCSTACGISSVKNSRRVINGHDTETGEWPWVVAIASLENNVPKIICGGAVINSRTVVTAAHCLETDPLILYFGKLYRSDENDDTNVMRRQSTRMIRHPDYNNSTYDSDIGLIVFPAIRFTDRVQPICLPTHESTARNLMDGVTGYVTGWGLTEHSLLANRLLVAQLPYVNNTECLLAHRRQEPNLSITRNMFCAGFKDGQQSACTGDSGSPLVFYDRPTSRYTIEGLVSFGFGDQCGMPESYTVFTKVSLFAPWIIQNRQ